MHLSGIQTETKLHETTSECRSATGGRQYQQRVCHMTYSEKAGVIPPLACTARRQIDDARSLSRPNTSKDTESPRISGTRDVNTHALRTPILLARLALLSGPVAPSHKGAVSQGFLVSCLAEDKKDRFIFLCLTESVRRANCGHKANHSGDLHFDDLCSVRELLSMPMRWLKASRAMIS